MFSLRGDGGGKEMSIKCVFAHGSRAVIGTKDRSDRSVNKPGPGLTTSLTLRSISKPMATQYLLRQSMISYKKPFSILHTLVNIFSALIGCFNPIALQSPPFSPMADGQLCPQ